MDQSKTLTSDVKFAVLTDLVKSGNCHAFVGAGMSRPVYPTWDELVYRLCESSGIDPTDSSFGRNPKKQTLARIARDADPTAYVRELNAIFSKKEPTTRCHLLAKIPFASYLTTNFDSMLLDARRIHHGSATYTEFPGLKVRGLKPGEVVYLHGRIHHDSAPDASPALVLTDNEFGDAYKNSLLKSFLEQFLSFESVVFLGCGMQDEYLNSVLKLCKSHRERIGSLNDANAPHWFILVHHCEKVPKGWEACGIEVVRYDRVNADFDGLQSVLEHWAGIQRPVARPMFDDKKVTYIESEEVPR